MNRPNSLALTPLALLFVADTDTSFTSFTFSPTQPTAHVAPRNSRMLLAASAPVRRSAGPRRSGSGSGSGLGVGLSGFMESAVLGAAGAF